MANKRAVFDRLAGLETEYAIRIPSSDPASSRPTRFELYQALVAALRRRLPVVQARHFKDGVFTAIGGAVWFETERPAAGSGLIEGATPECRGPRELLRYQRAQDRLLEEAAAASSVPFSLVKNDRDASDNVYGAQENYEATLAEGWRLFAWRLGLVALLPLAIFTWLGFLLLAALMILYLIVAGLLYLPLRALLRHSQSLALLLFGADFVYGREMGCVTPRWLETVSQTAWRVVTFPLAVALLGLCWLCAFVPHRKRMAAFLVSRPLIAGAGMLDRDGRFVLADKAPAINCILGYGGLFRDRPMITLGHFFKAISADAWFSPQDLTDLLGARQRLQIGLGDSNMAETAEYLRVGTTLLVLDALEAGELDEAPRLRRPIAALRTVCRDTTLGEPLPLAGGSRATALDLQWFYLNACRKHVRQAADAPQEAWEVLRLWEETLEQLEAYRREPDAQSALLGKLDWFTKRHLLAQARPDADWEARKKIDIRYHELSPLGYFRLLDSAGFAPRVLSEEEVTRSLRLPPANTPATRRGHYIREFLQDNTSLSVNWKTVVIGRGRQSRAIRLTDYRGRGQPPGPHPTAPRPK